MLFGNLDWCKGFSIVTDYYTEVVKPVFFLLNCFIGKSGKGHLLLLVYLQ